MEKEIENFQFFTSCDIHWGGLHTYHSCPFDKIQRGGARLRRDEFSISP